MRDVDIHALCAGPLHLRINGACDNVTGRQGTELVIFSHEFAPGSIDQFAAFSPHRLADQERFFRRVKKTGWMELNKFHVRDGCSGAPSHRYPVSGRDIGVRGIEINLSAAASGQDHSIAAYCFDVAGGLIENVNADHAILGGVAKLAGRNQVNAHVVVEDLDMRFLDHGIEQALLNFAPGGILIVKDAPFGVSAFSSQIQFPQSSLQYSFVEVDADSHQFADGGGSPRHDCADCFRIAQSGAGYHGVRNMQIERILGTGHTRDATLGPGGIGVGRPTFGHDGDGTMLRKLERETKTRDAAADDNKINLIHGIAWLVAWVGRGKINH